MDEPVQQIVRSSVSFLAILNPFALCLYLAGVMEDLDRRAFNAVLARATLISLAAFCLFTLAGEPLLTTVLGVDPNAMRIFGGVIFFVVAYNYVTKGYRATEILRGQLDDLPSAIALPFMIGAGTLTESILIGKRHSAGIAVTLILLDMLLCFLIVAGFKVLKDHLSKVRERVFDRYVNILARVNGLLIGAISTDMIIEGARSLWRGHVAQ